MPRLRDLLFAWTVAKHVKSNAIVYVKDGATVGVGAGQMSRVDSTRIAARKAEDMAEALGLPASPDHRLGRGVGCVLPLRRRPDRPRPRPGRPPSSSPAASMRDDEVIAAADERGPCDGLHRPAPFPALTMRPLLDHRRRHLRRSIRRRSWASCYGLEPDQAGRD